MLRNYVIIWFHLHILYNSICSDGISLNRGEASELSEFLALASSPIIKHTSNSISPTKNKQLIQAT